jgi:hypothetical protein
MKKTILVILGIGTAGFLGYHILSLPKISITNVDNINKTVSFQLVSKLSVLIDGAFSFGKPAIGISHGSYTVQQTDINGTQKGIQVTALKNGKTILQENVYFQ